MNIKKLIEKFSDNLGPKVVCLCLAILCYVFNMFTSLERKTFVVPLSVQSDSVFQPVSNLPKYVRVTVKTNPENLPSITASSFKAYVNFDRYTQAGQAFVPVTVTLAENLMLMETLEYSVKPETLFVELDESVLRYVPVSASLSGTVEHGYEITNVDISPATVKVTGPSEIVNELKAIDTRKVNVNGAASSLTQEVKLDNRFSKINVMPESDFKVTVAIAPAQGSQKFQNLEILCTSLPENLEITGKLPLVSITAAGPVPVLESYKPGSNVVSVDFSEVEEPGTYELPVMVKLPINLTLESQSVNTISVSVVQKAVLDETDSSENPSEQSTAEE